MGLFMTITLLFLGLLAATDFVVALVPQTEKIVDAVKPNRGWFGLVFTFWGLWIVISSILNMGWMGLGLKWMLWWLTYLLCGVLLAGVGFLVGFEKIVELFGKNIGEDKLEQIKTKLAPHQRNLGLASIGLAIWAFLFNLIVL